MENSHCSSLAIPNSQQFQRLDVGFTEVTSAIMDDDQTETIGVHQCKFLTNCTNELIGKSALRLPTLAIWLNHSDDRIVSIYLFRT